MRRRSILLALTMIAATLVAATPPARAVVTTRFVDDLIFPACDDATTDSSVTPYCTIQAAVDDSADGDTVQIAAGTYTSSTTYVVDITDDLDVSLIGAGEGSTIIDGEGQRIGLRAQDGVITVQDLTITRGAGVSVSGAGMLMYGTGNKTITDVTLHLNSSTATGGGAYVDPHNSAEVTFTRVTFTQNTANDATFGNGGAFDAIGSGTIEFIDSIFTGNSTAGKGGAIHIDSSGLVVGVEGSAFTDNASGGNGGAIFLNGDSSTTLEVTDSSFHSNETSVSASGGGGAIYMTDTPMVLITGSAFTENSTGDADGGAYGGAVSDVTDQNLTVVNSTFQGNSALVGGAIYSEGYLFSVTVSGNTAGTGGGIVDSGNGLLTLTNSIIHGNTAVTIGSNDCSGTWISGGYNLVGDPGTCPVGGDTATLLLGDDPLLSPPADNGGLTATMAIAPQSPARDKGSPATPHGSGGGACETVDQRGEPRNDTRCDIGAFEVGPQVLRYAGNNRYATAAAVAAAEYPVGAQQVFIATGFNFPDALAGAVPAGIFEAPLLLVDGGIPPATATSLTELEPFLITILGGPGAVSLATETALEAYSLDGERIYSSNRYLTAVAISQASFPADGSADIVYVATGLGFADALAAAPAAAYGNGPVLLVDGVSLHQAVADEIVRLTPDRIVVVGGTSAVSDAVLTALDALQGGDTVDRISGNNRYATAVAISADAFVDGTSWVYIATGLNFPDALAGAAVAGARSAPVLLVPGTSLPAEVSAEITRLGAKTIVILGGTAVVSSTVEDALKNLIGAD